MNVIASPAGRLAHYRKGRHWFIIIIIREGEDNIMITRGSSGHFRHTLVRFQGQFKQPTFSGLKVFTQ